MPSRVLSLGYSQNVYKLRLVETQGLPTERYCALSYCWGGDQKVKTTSANLASFKVDIDFNALPATIQDAAKTAYNLGFCYLFVDALCIVQDEKLDIATQIAAMPDIYGEAALTIIAASSVNAATDFLQRRTYLEADVSLRDAWKRRQLIRMGFRGHGGKLGSVILARKELVKDHAHIDTRAWTLQEKLLSRRILAYGKDQTTWTCCTVKQYTDGWLDNHAASIDSLRSIFHPHMQQPNQSTNSGQKPLNRYPLERILTFWDRVVSQFLTRSLSNPNDKLLAIGAVAQRFHAALNDDYLAGLWRCGLARGLLWTVTPLL